MTAILSKVTEAVIVGAIGAAAGAILSATGFRCAAGSSLQGGHARYLRRVCSSPWSLAAGGSSQRF